MSTLQHHRYLTSYSFIPLGVCAWYLQSAIHTALPSQPLVSRPRPDLRLWFLLWSQLHRVHVMKQSILAWQLVDYFGLCKDRGAIASVARWFSVCMWAVIILNLIYSAIGCYHKYNFLSDRLTSICWCKDCISKFTFYTQHVLKLKKVWGDFEPII